MNRFALFVLLLILTCTITLWHWPSNAAQNPRSFGETGDEIANYDVRTDESKAASAARALAFETHAATGGAQCRDVGLLTVEAINAEGHYLLGTLLQRRNELEKAVSAYQSAIYWNPRHLAGHLALGRLFLARNDRALALTHARQALQIKPQNREAVALKQQIETGR